MADGVKRVQIPLSYPHATRRLRCGASGHATITNAGRHEIHAPLHFMCGLDNPRGCNCPARSQREQNGSGEARTQTNANTSSSSLDEFSENKSLLTLLLRKRRELQLVAFLSLNRNRRLATFPCKSVIIHVKFILIDKIKNIKSIFALFAYLERRWTTKSTNMSCNAEGRLDSFLRKNGPSKFRMIVSEQDYLNPGLKTAFNKSLSTLKIC